MNKPVSQTTVLPCTFWQVVPDRLTDAMRDAFWSHMTRDVEDGKASTADECWAAMLAASPVGMTKRNPRTTTDDDPITDAMAERYTRDDEECIRHEGTTVYVLSITHIKDGANLRLTVHATLEGAKAEGAKWAGERLGGTYFDAGWREYPPVGLYPYWAMWDIEILSIVIDLREVEA